ncbi:MAG: tRNA (adenosine(37)-N6)-threonylcarbamoyltransferase complex ATPase subunit type 1 TsaE [Clostridiales bacterium]|nr:tRNA (adenosine(37)-N6)-threonylcarbamoyltransferase complex ATPase subunit type 1 TsaE [Clostridiales bacterium]
MYNFISKNENETINLAKNIAKFLKHGNIIILSGDLGSGKTKFTQGILEYFNLENEISSPTFTIVNEYNAENTNIYHFDVYRLSDSDEFFAIGGEEYLTNGICIIEWGEIIEDILPNDYIKIIFSKDTQNDNYRHLQITATGESSKNIINSILKNNAKGEI